MDRSDRTSSSKGIHHISVISGDGRRNAEFYVNTLGLRMVMKTVNQDDPFNYHLFYANESGQPGSAITFFPWPMAVQGKPGSGEATTVSFAVPPESVEFWAERFGEREVDFDGPYERFGKQVMGFNDPDRLRLELVFDSGVTDFPAWEEGSVPGEYGIRGFWGTTMQLEETEATGEVLENILGFEKKLTEKNKTLYQAGSPVGGCVILEQVESKRGQNGRGIVHHVAFRAGDTDELEEMRLEVKKRGLSPTEIIDRVFFKSVYFQSPGGVLFEIATDGPGYGAAMEEAEWGRTLYLPEWLEPRRKMIEKRLPEINIQ